MKLLLVLAVTLTCLMYEAVCWVPGGLAESDPNSEDVQRAAKLCLDLLDDSSTQGLAQRVRKVLSAKTQVVSGINYVLQVEVGLLGCSESQAAANSAVVKTGVCDFELYEQPWTNTKKLTSWTCGPFVNL